MSFNGQKRDLQIPRCFFLKIDRLLVLDILKTEEKKAAFAIVLFPIQNILDEGHYLSRKQVESALTETENWDLLVDGTSRDVRKMISAHC